MSTRTERNTLVSRRWMIGELGSGVVAGEAAKVLVMDGTVGIVLGCPAGLEGDIP